MKTKPTIKQAIDENKGIPKKQIRELYAPNLQARDKVKMLLYFIGCVLMPITLGGALLGYVRGYRKFMFPWNKQPELEDMPSVVKLSMVAGAILIWVTIIAFLIGSFLLVITIFGSGAWVIFSYFVANLVLSVCTFMAFEHWKVGVQSYLFEQSKYGTARYANAEELEPYFGKPGFYIGGGYTFPDKGHILTTAGTRSGKFTNLIAPNLLGLGGYKDSWVVVDPKGEATAVTARYQMESGKNVVILNPWGEHGDILPKSSSYNPLDILKDKTSIHLVDDAGMIAEMIIPVDKSDKDKFFSDNARSILTGLLLHLVTSEKKEPVVLKTIWEWVRAKQADWDALLEDMRMNDDSVNGEIVQKAGNEIMRLMKTGERTFGIIMAYLLQATDFIKSPSLQKSMQSGFDPKTLSDGNTALYIIIPADKLTSHFRWLRLMITTTMRAVVRNPNRRVCFILDEFAALGNLPEIEIAFSTYAGYNITVWPILQSLKQLEHIYEQNWETFIGNAAVRHFFGVNDNFTAEYVSDGVGLASHSKAERNFFKIKSVVANERALITSDEIRRGSGKNIFTFINSLPITVFNKQPYYEMEQLKTGGKNRYDPNPFYKEEKSEEKVPT